MFIAMETSWFPFIVRVTAATISRLSFLLFLFEIRMCFFFSTFVQNTKTGNNNKTI